MYADGNGLYLRVDPSGTKRWVQRLTVHHRRRHIGLGGWPMVTLTEARDVAYENRRLARAGGDPLAEKRRRAMPTFAEAARTVIAMHRPTWRSAKHAAQWSATLEAYAYPEMRSLSVGTITTADVLRVLAPIWTTKAETARRVRQRIGAVMEWAIAQGYRSDNPAGEAITAVLPRTARSREHHAALDHREVVHVIRAVRDSTASLSVRLAFELLVLTAARSGEVRHARWSEVDVAAATWTIPAERMKAGKPHRVPLSKRALAVLAPAKKLDGGEGLLFPSANSKPHSNMAFTQLLRRLGVQAVPHGFRSSFRDWASEYTDSPHAVMEAALAHTVPSAVEAAYARSDLFDRRRVLMEAWADYLNV